MAYCNLIDLLTPGPTCGTVEMKPKHANLSTVEGISPFHVLINTANVTSIKSDDVIANKSTSPSFVKGKFNT